MELTAAYRQERKLTVSYNREVGNVPKICNIAKRKM
jgi:hypothetical protein